MIFQPLPPQSGQTVSVGMMFYYRAGGVPKDLWGNQFAKLELCTHA
jgi:hypothetical protein